MTAEEQVRRWVAGWLLVELELSRADAGEVGERWRTLFGIERHRHGKSISNSVRDPRAIGDRARLHLQKELIRSPTESLVVFAPSQVVALKGTPSSAAATAVIDGLGALQHECVVAPLHFEWSFVASRYDWDLFLLPRYVSEQPDD